MTKIENFCKRAKIPEYRDDLPDSDKRNINAVKVIQFMVDEGIVEDFRYQGFIRLVYLLRKSVKGGDE